MSNYCRVSGTLKIPYLRNNANSTAVSVKQKKISRVHYQKLALGQVFITVEFFEPVGNSFNTQLCQHLCVWRAPVCEPCGNHLQAGTYCQAAAVPSSLPSSQCPHMYQPTSRAQSCASAYRAGNERLKVSRGIQSKFRNRSERVRE